MGVSAIPAPLWGADEKIKLPVPALPELFAIHGEKIWKKIAPKKIGK